MDERMVYIDHELQSTKWLVACLYILAGRTCDLAILAAVAHTRYAHPSESQACLTILLYGDGSI